MCLYYLAVIILNLNVNSLNPISISKPSFYYKLVNLKSPVLSLTPPFKGFKRFSLTKKLGSGVKLLKRGGLYYSVVYNLGCDKTLHLIKQYIVYILNAKCQI